MITKKNKNVSYIEFIILVSLLMSLAALSIDAMLPALSHISTELDIKNSNDRQLIISMLLLGSAIGQLFFGPLSDMAGRKPAMYAGLFCFMAGSILSAFAFTFPMILFGRLIQGLGVSAPRAVTLAIIRDRYEGRKMAQVVSFTMTIFILVPMIAPSLGQGLLLLWGWRSIFGSFVVLSAVSLTWFSLRQSETLALEKRAPFSVKQILNTATQIVKIRPAIGYTLTAGLIAGTHVGYLNSAQQIFQEQYGVIELFPIYFAVIALSLGAASFINARLVMRFGMRLLVKWSLIGITGLSIGFFIVALTAAGHPPFLLLMIYFVLIFFCLGILYGNLNAIAMEPLGKFAGSGAAIVGSLSTLISVLLGTFIGRSFNSTVLPLVAGMAVPAGLSIFLVRWADKKKPAGS